MQLIEVHSSIQTRWINCLPVYILQSIDHLEAWEFIRVNIVSFCTAPNYRRRDVEQSAQNSFFFKKKLCHQTLEIIMKP